MKIPFLSQFLNSEADMKSGAPKITYDSSVSAGQKTRFGALLTNIRHELPDLLAVSVVELRSGKLLATHHIAGKLAPGKAAGHNAEIIRQKQQALQALGLAEQETIEDILVTLDTQWHILRLLPGNRTFLHLMVNIRDTNLGIAREVVRSQAQVVA